MICPGCGAPVPEESRFCNMCGTTVAAPVADIAGAPVTVQARPAPVAGEQSIWELRPAFLFVGLRYVVAALFWLVVSGLVAAGASRFHLPTASGAIIVLLVGIVLFFYPVVAHIRRQRVLYTLTNHKLEIREGLLSTVIRNVPLVKIQDVTVSRSFLERLLGLGSIGIDNASETSGSVTIGPVRDPQRYADLLLNELRRRN